MSSGRNKGGGIPAFIQSPGLVAKSGLKMKQQQQIPTMTADYMDAVHVLNEGLMNQACSILLDDANENGEKKLLEMYQRCDQAYQVIKKHAPANINPSSINGTSTITGGIPGAPNLNIPLASSTKNGVPGVGPGIRPKLKKMGGGDRGGLGGSERSLGTGMVPMRRGLMSASQKPSSSQLKSLNTLSDDSNILPPASKKQRVSPKNAGSGGNGSNSSIETAGAGSGSGGSGDKVMAPPQSALKFLAKLNRGGGDKKELKKKSSPPSSTDGDDGDDSEEGDSGIEERKSNNSSPPPPPTRKNPSRGSSVHRRGSTGPI